MSEQRPANSPTAPAAKAAPTHHAAINPFAVKGDELVIGNVPIRQLAQRVGRTPFYAYDRSLLDARVALLRQHLPKAVKLHYAMKANPMPALVCHMARLVDGLDVASGGELAVALDAGADPREISFAGPGKNEIELAQAVAAGILINIESPREIELLTDICARCQLPARVALRVNPDFELKTSGMKMGGGPKQFGIDAEQIPAVLARIGELAALAKSKGNAHSVQFEGFHLYAGSQNLRAEAIIEAQQKCYELALRLAQHAPAPVKTLNLGGGFGIPYFPGEAPLDVTSIGQNLDALAKRCAQEMPHASITIELGRYLVGEAGVYVCQVLDRKISREQVFLVTDGGLHHHLAASGNFGQVIRKNYPVLIGNRMQSTTRESASVVGPLCTPLDLLADRMDLPQAQPGDLVVVLQSGAYGPTASPQRFLSHAGVVEVLV